MKKKILIFTKLFCLSFFLLACPEENKPKPKEKNSDGGMVTDDNEIKMSDDNHTKSSTGTLDDHDVVKNQDDKDTAIDDTSIDDNDVIFKTDGKIGSACKNTDDCLISNNAQMQSLCLDDTVKAQSIGFHAGYCTVVGCDYFAAVGQMSPTSANSCPDGSACSQLLANSESADPNQRFQYMCMKTCKEPTDCRAGYQCQLSYNGNSICVPGCTKNEECTLGSTCDIPSAACVNTSTAEVKVGALCTTDNDCNKGAGMCIPAQSGFTGGYCTERSCSGIYFGTTDTDSCDANGGQCLFQIPGYTGTCFASCSSWQDCSRGDANSKYTCQVTSTGGVCVLGCVDNTQCSQIQPGTLCNTVADHPHRGNCEFPAAGTTTSTLADNQFLALDAVEKKKVGDACSSDDDCPYRAMCIKEQGFVDGYCSVILCDDHGMSPTKANPYNPCPQGSVCLSQPAQAQNPFNVSFCVDSCDTTPENSCRTGYTCLPGSYIGLSGSVCIPTALLGP